MQSSDTLQSRKKKWHFSIEKDFVCDESLSPMARMLYIVLMSFASPSSPVPFPGMRLLGRLLHCTEDTVRKYRRELEDRMWIEVEHRRDGHNKFSRNAYILLDGPEPGAMPKKPGMDNFRIGEFGTRENTGAKSLPGREEETSEAKSNQQEQYRASGDGATGAGDSTPSAIQGPRSNAEKFIQDYRAWGKAARVSATVIPAERTALQEFFTDNANFTPGELTAIMLAAWLMDSATITPGTENHETYWHCRVKSRRIKTFLQFLPNIQDELEWKGQPQAEKIMRIAQQRFLQQKAA